MAEFTIREATVADAAALLVHLQTIAEEPHNGVSYSSLAELNMRETDLAQTITHHAEQANALYLVALAGEQIIGEIHGGGGRLGYRGTVNLTMTVARDWRDKGAGSALLHALIAWGQDNPLIHRLELYVFPNNSRAIHVYEKLGFQHEGSHREAYFKEGQYLDLMVMGMLFERD